MWACLVDAYARFFSYYIRQQTILAYVTVGCQSNGRRVSSISDLLAPAAKAAPAGPPTPASHGRLCCRAGLSAPTTPTAGQGIPLLTHTPCYSAATAASRRSRTSEPSYSSPRGHPLPRRPLPRPRRCPPPWCSRRGVVNVVNDRLPSEEYCTWRG